MKSKWQKGTIIDNRYRVHSQLGQGGQGQVFLVEDSIHDNAHKALKTLSREIMPQNLERMRREVKALQGTSSPFVLSIEDSNLESYRPGQDVPPYFVSEYAKYGTLRQHNYFNGEIELSLRIFQNICEGVKAIHHAGVIHRDLKPSNILLVSHEKDIRIGDFGICYIDLEIDQERATQIREKVGPMYFAAPEQTSLPPNFTQKSDIYSLGRILYYLITGRYQFTPAEEYVPVTVQIGMRTFHPVDDLIKRLISFDPRERPESVDQVIDAVDRLLGKNSDEKPTFELSKMQKRIMKYLGSAPHVEATFNEILEYLSGFYGVTRQPEPTTDAIMFFRAFNYAQSNWEDLADRVEASLEQLEEAGLVAFFRGSYSLAT
ncbi:MAG: serine/threonine protein kinase [Chloroflexi bacterium]|nr:serine/threonine protein kinase [Chloroflexota bacterium]MCI0647956.1 serine/threonine protein kinase [Chloroflexota bacterium]MCI0726466.1 serine/threonine protein kinase [Chloroflexota bacterium]